GRCAADRGGLPSDRHAAARPGAGHGLDDELDGHEQHRQQPGRAALGRRRLVDEQHRQLESAVLAARHRRHDGRVVEQPAPAGAAGLGERPAAAGPARLLARRGQRQLTDSTFTMGGDASSAPQSTIAWSASAPPSMTGSKTSLSVTRMSRPAPPYSEDGPKCDARRSLPSPPSSEDGPKCDARRSLPSPPSSVDDEAPPPSSSSPLGPSPKPPKNWSGTSTAPPVPLLPTPARRS